MQLDLIERPVIRRTTSAEARAKRDLGMQRVGDRAERCTPGWTEVVLARVAAFSRAQAGYWTIEQMRAVLAAEVPEPPDLRAWGAVTRLALKRGLIQHTGKSAPTCSSNAAQKPMFKRGPCA